jgi:hypothetical protein
LSKKTTTCCSLSPFDFVAQLLAKEGDQMKKLTDELLVEAYFAALKHELDPTFIYLLLNEILDRKIKTE